MIDFCKTTYVYCTRYENCFRLWQGGSDDYYTYYHPGDAIAGAGCWNGILKPVFIDWLQIHRPDIDIGTVKTQFLENRVQAMAYNQRQINTFKLKIRSLRIDSIPEQPSVNGPIGPFTGLDPKVFWTKNSNLLCYHSEYWAIDNNLEYQEDTYRGRFPTADQWEEIFPLVCGHADRYPTTGPSLKILCDFVKEKFDKDIAYFTEEVKKLKSEIAKFQAEIDCLA
jgi:hypothetical protein